MKISEHPLVSVLMSVYNSSEFLSESIDSILSQSCAHFEFLIINDASTDDCKEIIFSFYDERIEYIENETNLGLTLSLNKGLEKAKGKYIARMDADDISLPNRLEKQVHYLEGHPDIGVLGTWFKKTSSKHAVKNPIEHSDIHGSLFFYNPVAHPTVMIRKSVLDKFSLTYDEEYEKSQDYELWSRLVELTKLANLPEVLLIYRTHEDQLSKAYGKAQANFDLKVKFKMFRNILDIEDSAVSSFVESVFGTMDIKGSETYRVLESISFRNLKGYSVNKSFFSKLMLNSMNKALLRSSQRVSDVQHVFFSRVFYFASFKEKIKFTAKLFWS